MPTSGTLSQKQATHFLHEVLWAKGYRVNTLANRVFPNKVNGLIVDYMGVFKDLRKALRIYGSASGGGITDGDIPVKPKAALVEQLRQAIAETIAFCTARGIHFSQLESATGFTRTKFWADAVEAIIINDQSKRTYLSLIGNVHKLYKAILPDPLANEFTAIQAQFERIKEQIYSEAPDISRWAGNFITM